MDLSALLPHLPLHTLTRIDCALEGDWSETVAPIWTPGDGFLGFPDPAISQPPACFQRAASWYSGLHPGLTRNQAGQTFSLIWLFLLHALLCQRCTSIIEILERKSSKVSFNSCIYPSQFLTTGMSSLNSSSQV